MSSLALDFDSSDTPDGLFVSAVSNQAFTGQSAAKALGSVSSGDMMGPAFNQPPGEIKTTAVGLSTAGLLNRSRQGSSGSMVGGYQPVAARPDPVAEVNAFLSANSSPSALSNREPYRSNILPPSLPTVYLPDPASITSDLGDSSNMQSQAAYSDNASFAGVGLPVFESVESVESTTRGALQFIWKFFSAIRGCFESESANLSTGELSDCKCSNHSSDP